MLQQFLGVCFLFIGMVSISSYTDELEVIRIPFFYKELEPMRQRWGNTVGTILHLIGYTLIPLGFGVIFLSGMFFK